MAKNCLNTNWIIYLFLISLINFLISLISIFLYCTEKRVLCSQWIPTTSSVSLLCLRNMLFLDVSLIKVLQAGSDITVNSQVLIPCVSISADTPYIYFKIIYIWKSRLPSHSTSQLSLFYWKVCHIYRCSSITEHRAENIPPIVLMPIVIQLGK